MVLSITNASAILACDNIVDAAEGGAGDAQASLSIYDGTPPVNVDTTLSGNTLLAELEMTNPAFGAAVDAAPGAIATAAAISDDVSADATGTASFFRIFNLSNVAVIQGAVSTSGAELNFNTVAFQIGATVEITSLTITMPEA